MLDFLFFLSFRLANFIFFVRDRELRISVFMFWDSERVLPKSFTLAEVLIVCQTFSLTFWASTMNILNTKTGILELTRRDVTIFYGHVSQQQQQLY